MPTLGSNNPYPSILIDESTQPASPSAGFQRLFISTSDHALRRVNSTGGALNMDARTISLTLDGGGAVLTTGIKSDVRIPVACTITANRVLADTSGSVVIDIWKDSYTNFPPTSADSIVASAPPTLSTSIKSEDTTLTGWTVAIAAGDILRFQVNSVASITRLHLALDVTASV